MQRTALGNTGLTVNPLVFGTLPMGPLQADLPAPEGGRLIRYALERGINLVDTAELYGTYAHIRAAIDGFRGECRIATKTHATDAEQARSHVERAMKELGVERLDIVHLHGARLADPFIERAEVFEELLKLKEEGKIVHIGLSSHYISAIRKAADNPHIDVVHPLINRLGMGILDGTAEQMAEAIAHASKAGKGVYAMKALAGGNFIAEARDRFKYVLGLPGVDAVAVGMLSEKEVDANLALFIEGRSNDEEWKDLESRRRRLRIMDRFCKRCGECVEACTNNALSLEESGVQLNEEECILCGYCAAACPEFVIRVI